MGGPGAFSLGSNKEAFDAEVYAIYQALSIMGQRQESGRSYTLFVDSTSAISRIRSDVIGPGQRFAVASIEVATRILARDNGITVRSVPAHHEIRGNEKADELAKAAAEGSRLDNAVRVSDEYRWETSLLHMTRMATEARSRSAASWMRDRFGNPANKCRPPPGEGPEA